MENDWYGNTYVYNYEPYGIWSQATLRYINVMLDIKFLLSTSQKILSPSPRTQISNASQSRKLYSASAVTCSPPATNKLLGNSFLN